MVVVGCNLVGCFRGSILWAGLLGGYRSAEGFALRGGRRAERGAHRTPAIERAADGNHSTTHFLGWFWGGWIFGGI